MLNIIENLPLLGTVPVALHVSLTPPDHLTGSTVTISKDQMRKLSCKELANDIRVGQDFCLASLNPEPRRLPTLLG